MKNENIHRDFSRDNVRTFLAQELQNARTEGGGSWSVEYVEKEILRFQNLLLVAKKYESVKCLIKDNGWQEWDISEHVPYKNEKYFPFIGTEEEYDGLLAIIELEEEKNERKI